MPSIGPAGDVNIIQLNQTTLQAMYENGGMPVGTSAKSDGAFFDQTTPDDTNNAIGDPNDSKAGGFDAWSRRAAINLGNLKNGHAKPRSQSRTSAAIETSPTPALIKLPDYRQESDFDCG